MAKTFSEQSQIVSSLISRQDSVTVHNTGERVLISLNDESALSRQDPALAVSTYHFLWFEYFLV